MRKRIVMLGVVAAQLMAVGIGRADDAAPMGLPPGPQTAAPTPVASMMVPVVPGAHTHDGFLLRFTPGIGAFGEAFSDSSSVSGAGVAGDLVIGGNVAPGVIIFGESASVFASDPTITLTDGSEITASGVTMNAYFLGAGIAAYSASNFFGQVAIGANWVAADGPGGSGSSDTGFATRFVAGKEWWVSDNWGLGLAAHLQYGRVSDGGNSAGLATFGLHLSATYD